jgi:hypothetical protein
MDKNILPIIRAGDVVEIEAHDYQPGNEVFSRPVGQYVVDYVFHSGNLWAYRERDDSPRDRQHSFHVIPAKHVRRLVRKADERRAA